jgi:hypothetical protein
LVCIYCGAGFLLGRCCYRGQAYCSALCVKRARAESLRAARTRYEASAKGRRAHRERENRYRKRRREAEALRSRNVTDQPSAPPGIAVTHVGETAAVMPAAVTEDDSLQAAKGEDGQSVYARPGSSRRQQSACSSCGRPGSVVLWEVRPGSGRRGSWASHVSKGAAPIRTVHHFRPVGPPGSSWGGGRR